MTLEDLAANGQIVDHGAAIQRRARCLRGRGC
jgi:hypothetical protein